MCNSTLNSGFAVSNHKFGFDPLKAVDPTPSAEPLRPGFSWSRTGSDPRFVGLFFWLRFFPFLGLPYVGCRQGKPATFINGMVVHNTATGRQTVAFGAILQPLTCISASPCFHAMLAFARYLMDL